MKKQYILNEMSLKELNELSISSIGVLDKDGGFQASHTARNLVIGLGGMGLKTVLKLKRELNDRMGKIDGSYLQILSLDTDSEDREKAITSGILVPDEIPQLNNSDLTAVLKALPMHRPAAVTAIIPEGFDPVLSGIGANQIRLAGRLTVMDMNLFGLIFTSIKNAISRLKHFAIATLNVHIVAGIGGGTGSGLVVDIPYIVRSVISQLGISESATRIFGHVYLPNSYTGIANEKAAYRNGYAALKEIDYFMNIEKKGETFDALYPAPVGNFSSQKNIFDQCTLIGGQIEGDIIIDNPQQKAIAVCVEDLVNQCTSVVRNIDDKGNTGSITDFFTDGSFHVNTGTALDTVMSDPGNKFPGHHDYCYNFIGSSSIKFPTDYIVEQLIGEMSGAADNLLVGNIGNLRQEDVDAFEFGLIRPIDVIEGYARGLSDTIDNINNDPDTKWTQTSVKTSTHTEPLDQAATLAVQNFNNSYNGAIETAIANANRKAQEIFCDPRRGPYYLAELLTSRSAGGGRVVGFFEKLGKYDSEVVDASRAFEQTKIDLERQLQSTIEEMQGGLFGSGFKKHLDNYKELIKNLALTKFKIRLCEALIREFYINMDEQRGASYRIKISLEHNYLFYVDVFAMIMEVTKGNLSVAKEKLGFGTTPDSDPAKDPTSIFSLMDVEFTALKSTIRGTADRKIAQLGDSGAVNFAGALTSAIMDNKAAWNLKKTDSYEASECAATFRRFIKNYQPFSDVVNRKMIDYFNEAYEGQSGAYKLSVIQKLVNAVKYNSAPMVKVWGAPYFNLAQVQPLCYQYMVLPNGLDGDGNTWGSLFKSAFGTNGLTNNIYWSPDQDSIYSYTLYAKMPIWLHSRIPEYEEQYKSMQIPGVHINEGPSAEVALKDFPALMPTDQYYRTRNGNIEYSNADELKYWDELKTLYNTAKKHGIIRKSDNGLYVFDTITDKPDPSDGRSAERITRFVNNFIDSLGTSEKYEGPLFAEMKNSFGSEIRIIQVGLGGYAPTDDEKAVNLLRRQMRLVKLIRDELDYYKSNFVPPVKEEIDRRRRMRAVHDFAKYILFGLVSSEMGTWNYRLGDAKYNIIAKYNVTDDNSIAWQAQYMEMPACAKFSELIKADDKGHKNLLDTRVTTIQRSIAEGDRAAYDELVANYNKLTERFNTIIGEVDMRAAAGNMLTDQEKTRKSFYTTLLDSIKTLMAAFAD